jgi:amidase
MAFSDYASYDGLGLAELVRRGEVQASELVEEAITRIERHNPTLNAVVHEIYDSAREIAGQTPATGTPGPFQGVPLVLKDILGDAQGVPSTSGSRFLAGRVASRDSELVIRYRRAGLIPVAKTNAPELGLVPTTEPQAYGPTRNPWNLDHSSGGSSGGSAACVAAGIVPIAHANDGGGSIRIPASCCGLVGLKPTRARNPLGPALGDVMGGMVAEHVVTRSVRDSAAVLDCTAGPDVGDPYWAPPPERPFLEEVARPPGRLRIAYWPRLPAGGALHSECVEAVESTTRLCEELGHDVVEATPPIDPGFVTQAFLTLWSAGAAGTIDALALVTGRKPDPAFFEPLTWAFYERGSAIRASEYLIAIIGLQLVTRQVARFLEEYDACLTTTLGAPPVRLGTIDTNESEIERAMEALGDYVPYTPLFNATGQPAISLPLHWSAEGLPIGLHFAARAGGEGLLYRLASQLEAARPWHDRTPPVWD